MAIEMFAASSSSHDDDLPLLCTQILQTQGSDLSVDQRRKAVRRLLASLATKERSKHYADEQTLFVAVSALKTLGRTSEGTEDLAAEEALKTLLNLSQLVTPAFASLVINELPPINAEALRCLANVCLLHESARVRLATFPKVAEAIIQASQGSPLSTQFLAARLLFLITTSGGEIIRRLVEELSIGKYLSSQLLAYMGALTSPIPTATVKLSSDILIEYLKVTFNVSLFYPRIAPNRLSPTMNNSPRLGSSTSSSGSSRSPSPVGSDKSGGSSAGKEKKSKAEKIKGMFSKKLSSASKKEQHGLLETDADVLRSWGFEDVVQSLATLALCLSTGADNTEGPFGVYKHVITSLLNFNVSTYSSIFFAPLSPASAPSIPSLPTTSPTAAAPSFPPLPARLLTLLDVCTRYYIPYSPDDEDARVKALEAPESLDECLSFLLLLLTKCAAEDYKGDVRKALKTCLLADDIDRSIGLEKRKDLTGRLIRLMSSTYMTACNDAAGKLLFCLCEQDPVLFAGTLGYGNASGFLQNINMLIPPGAVPDSSSGTANGNHPSINPITGTYDEPEVDDGPTMTDEEKEREAERLFVLFDRLNKNGAISVENPITAAKARGAFDSSAKEDEDERAKIQELNDQEEKEALEEMKRYKERKAKVAAS